VWEVRGIAEAELNMGSKPGWEVRDIAEVEWEHALEVRGIAEVEPSAESGHMVRGIAEVEDFEHVGKNTEGKGY